MSGITCILLLNKAVLMSNSSCDLALNLIVLNIWCCVCVWLYSFENICPPPNSTAATPEGKWPKNTPNVNRVDVRIQLMLNFETEMWLIILWYGLPQVKMDKKMAIKISKNWIWKRAFNYKRHFYKVAKICFCVNKTEI